MLESRAPEDLVDLERYPLQNLDSPTARGLIERVTGDLARDGASSLPGFLKPAAIELMAAEAEALGPLAHAGPTAVSPYYFNYDLADNRSPDHPTRHRGRRNLRLVPYDLIPQESALYRLYHWPVLPRFLARVLGYERLFRLEDPYQSLNISLMETGGCQQWHFDRGTFTTTILLQAAESGGVFEYAPQIRSEEDENFDAVAQVLKGDRDRVRRIVIEPGMLNLFQGHYSLHRVTQVEGPCRRIQTTLAFSPAPSVTGSLKSSLLHYGARVGVRAGLSGAEIRAMVERDHPG